MKMYFANVHVETWIWVCDVFLIFGGLINNIYVHYKTYLQVFLLIGRMWQTVGHANIKVAS